MYVVGLAQLASSVDAEAPLLAADLGVTPYEARLLLLPGMPALALISPERTRALELLSALRARGHDALAFDSMAVVGHQQMQAVRRFRFEADSLATEGPPPERLPYDDVLVLLRASHHSRVEATTEGKSRSFSAGRALLTGGLVMTKTTKSSSTARSEDRQDVLYIYRRSGSTPWCLREWGAKYEGLGEHMATTEHANFLTTVSMLRERAPGALYDDRLVTRKIPERIAQVAVQGIAQSSRVEVNSDAGVDMLAHLLAMWLVKRSVPAVPATP